MYISNWANRCAPQDLTTVMDPTQNKRKASTSPTPTTPAPPPKGARFFPPSFASPQTMPKKATAALLEYSDSPTLSRTLDYSVTSPLSSSEQDDTTQQEVATNEDTDMSGPNEHEGGVSDSMHAPHRNVTSTPRTPQPPPQTAQTPQTSQMAPTNTPSLIQSLSAVAEAALDMASFTPTNPHSDSHFTPTPVTLFPPTHRGLPGELLLGLSPDTVTAWCNVPEPKFFLRIFGYDGSRPHERHPIIIGLLRNAFEEIARNRGTLEPEARIAPPSPPTTPTAHPLITFLAYGLSTAATEEILKQRIWSSSDITFEALPFEAESTPRLILCITGFTFPDKNAVELAVKTTWSAEANESRMVDTLQQHDESFEGEELKTSARSFIAEMINSVKVEFVDCKGPGGVPAPRFNVYSVSPTGDMLAWSNIKALLFALTYPTLLTGTGRPIKVFPCQICHSFCHPRGLCPFPSLPGWNGPNHILERVIPTRGRGQGRSRGRAARRGPLF